MDSPVQQQEDDMRAMAAAHSAKMMRIMESRAKISLQVRESLGQTAARALDARSVVTQRKLLLGGSHVSRGGLGGGGVRAAGNRKDGTGGSRGKNDDFG